MTPNFCYLLIYLNWYRYKHEKTLFFFYLLLCKMCHCNILRITISQLSIYLNMNIRSSIDNIHKIREDCSTACFLEWHKIIQKCFGFLSYLLQYRSVCLVFPHAECTFPRISFRFDEFLMGFYFFKFSISSTDNPVFSEIVLVSKIPMRFLAISRDFFFSPFLIPFSNPFFSPSIIPEE